MAKERKVEKVARTTIKKVKSLVPYVKYRNTKKEYNGIKFDSTKELAEYLHLKEQEQFGIITDLKLQVRFLVIPKTLTERATHYVADFTYIKDGVQYVVDVKGFKTKDYILKRKLFKWQYPAYVFEER